MIPTGFVHGLGKPRRPARDLNPRHHDNQNANRYTDRAAGSPNPTIFRRWSAAEVRTGDRTRGTSSWIVSTKTSHDPDSETTRSTLCRICFSVRRAIWCNSSAEGSRLSFLSIIALK